MDASIVERVYRFVAEETAYPLRRIRPDTTLLRDIGFDGDDADEFFQHFASRFRVDMTGFDISRHFHSEVECLMNPFGCLLLPLALMKYLFWPDKRDLHEVCGKLPIRVRDLVQAAESKKM